MAGGTIQQLLNGAVIRQRGQVRSVSITDWWRCWQMNLPWKTGRQTHRQMDAHVQITSFPPTLLTFNWLSLYFQNDDDDEDDDYDDSNDDDDEDEGNALQPTTNCTDVYCTVVYRGVLYWTAFCSVIFRVVRSSISTVCLTSLFEHILCVYRWRGWGWRWGWRWWRFVKRY